MEYLRTGKGPGGWSRATKEGRDFWNCSEGPGAGWEGSGWQFLSRGMVCSLRIKDSQQIQGPVDYSRRETKYEAIEILLTLVP